MAGYEPASSDLTRRSLSFVLMHISDLILYDTGRAGLAGFEPTDAGVKVLCLTAWRQPWTVFKSNMEKKSRFFIFFTISFQSLLERIFEFWFFQKQLKIKFQNSDFIFSSRISNLISFPDKPNMENSFLFWIIFCECFLVFRFVLIQSGTLLCILSKAFVFILKKPFSVSGV